MKRIDVYFRCTIVPSIAFAGVVVGLGLCSGLSAQIAKAEDAPSLSPSLSNEEPLSCADPVVCNGNFVPDNQICECVCNLTTCENPGEVFDPTNCTCKEAPQTG